jgi:glucose-induced degradation protein 4
MIPSSPSSYLRAGSKFHGTQQSERQVYDVQVEIKHVDLKESFLCGYLRIQGMPRQPVPSHAVEPSLILD